jgi:hypothetical protein
VNSNLRDAPHALHFNRDEAVEVGVAARCPDKTME